MGASDSKGRRDPDSQGDRDLKDGTDTGTAIDPLRRRRRACVGDSGGFAGFHPFANNNAVYRDTEPRVILDNKSCYRVSYWVVEEDKNIVTAINKEAYEERLVGSMTRYLNGSSNTARGVGWAKQEDRSDEEEDGVYFLTRDHRMGPRGATQATKVPFPVKCHEMRVFSFFEEDGQWHNFQDRDISTGLFKKVFAITARDADIAPYAKHRWNSSHIR